jgi:hypothetical protein
MPQVSHILSIYYSQMNYYSTLHNFSHRQRRYHVINKHRQESFPNKPTFKLGFEFLTAMLMKIYIFCNITPCRQLRVDRRFGGTCRLHLQNQRINQGRNQHEAGSKQRSASVDFDFNSSVILCSVMLGVGNPNHSVKNPRVRRFCSIVLLEPSWRAHNQCPPCPSPSACLSL